MATEQGPLPEQSPPQTAKVEPPDATGMSVTICAAGKVYVQVAPQSMPAGELVTVPVPVPDLATVNEYVDAGPNSAVTDCALLIVTTQLPVPLQVAPLQPTKVEPAAAAADSVTAVAAG